MGTPKRKNPSDFQSYFSNYYTADRYFQAFKTLRQSKYRKLMNTYPFLFDARLSFQFLSILRLCNFVYPRSHIVLSKLINTITDKGKKEKAEMLFKTLTSSQYSKPLFNLRDKYISHRDKDWMFHDTDFPIDIFEMYLRVSKQVLEIVCADYNISFPESDYNMVDSIKMLFSNLEHS